MSTKEEGTCAEEASCVSRDRDVQRSDTMNMPSSLYRPDLWRLGLALVRVVPRGLCDFVAQCLASAYGRLALRRREVVVQNLLPAVDDDLRAARLKVKALLRHFALKVVDLWRYEAGLPVEYLLGPSSGWEEFERVQARRRGVLLLTPHLGNWEFGGPALRRRGVSLQVITMAEPGRNFTELRRASRARWGIETLVIGNDPFGVLEVVRRLESGSTVALLVDRPPPPTALTVRLFGRPFAASVAAAELARASGCALLPVYLPRAGKSYEAHVLPEIPYERNSLRDLEARRRLTQHIMDVFEPVIRRHCDQWYHFVPVFGPSAEPGPDLQAADVRNFEVQK